MIVHFWLLVSLPLKDIKRPTQANITKKADFPGLVFRSRKARKLAGRLVVEDQTDGLEAFTMNIRTSWTTISVSSDAWELKHQKWLKHLLRRFFGMVLRVKYLFIGGVWTLRVTCPNANCSTFPGFAFLVIFDFEPFLKGRLGIIVIFLGGFLKQILGFLNCFLNC